MAIGDVAALMPSTSNSTGLSSNRQRMGTSGGRSSGCGVGAPATDFGQGTRGRLHTRARPRWKARSSFGFASEIIIALGVFQVNGHSSVGPSNLPPSKPSTAFLRSHARTFALLDGCGRLRGYALGAENDAPRPRDNLRRAGLEPALRQRLRHHAGKVRFRARTRSAGRDRLRRIRGEGLA